MSHLISIRELCKHNVCTCVLYIVEVLRGLRTIGCRLGLDWTSINSCVILLFSKTLSHVFILVVKLISRAIIIDSIFTRFNHWSFYFLKIFWRNFDWFKRVFLICVKNELVKILKEPIQPPLLDSSLIQQVVGAIWVKMLILCLSAQLNIFRQGGRAALCCKWGTSIAWVSLLNSFR